MSGGHYKQCLIAHKLMFEALSRFKMISFLTWLSASEHRDKQDVKNFLKLAALHRTVVAQNVISYCTDDILLNQCSDSLKILLQNNTTFAKLYDEFVAHGSKTSGTFAMWSQYIADVQTLLWYVTAEKNTDWPEHLNCVKEILCYAFAYDHQNYSRCGPVYEAEMS